MRRCKDKENVAPKKGENASRARDGNARQPRAA